jgi:tetratricopeptide (TPR) repeat protein
MALLPQRFGPEETETGMCLLTAGLLAEKRHDEPTAEVYYRRAVGILEKSLGEDNRETARAINNLGCILKDLRRYDEAGACHTRALAIRTRMFGPVHADIAMSLRNFGTLMLAQKRYDEATAYYDRALAVAEQLNPIDANLIAGISVHVAAIAKVRGDLGRAEQILRTQMDAMVRIYGLDSPMSGRYATDLAEILWQTDRREEALGLYERVVAAYRKNLPSDHLTLAITVRRHGQMLQAVGRLDDALTELTDAANLAEGLRPARPDYVAACQRAVVSCLRAMGRTDEADRVEREIKGAEPVR